MRSEREGIVLVARIEPDFVGTTQIIQHRDDIAGFLIDDRRVKCPGTKLGACVIPSVLWCPSCIAAEQDLWCGTDSHALRSGTFWQRNREETDDYHLHGIDNLDAARLGIV